MMSRILGVIIVALIPILALQQCQVDDLSSTLDDTKKNLVRSQADLEVSIETANQNSREVDSLRDEINLRDLIAFRQLARSKAVAKELGDARKQLKEKADNDQKLRDYLDSNMHFFVAEWLWTGLDGSSSGEKGGSASISSSQSDGTDTQAYDPVTHEAGWDWARETDKALDSCNADKAAIRGWVNAQER